ncbi:MAG: hypothetical protein ACPG3Z_01625 [Saprospiraceae bacterium]
MKPIVRIFIILCLSTIYYSTTAQDMSGEWNGILRQSEGGAANSYYFTLNLKQKGNVITGVSKVTFIDKPDFYAVMELKGKFKDDILTFEETKIVKQNTFKDLEWCIKKAKLNFTFKKDGFCIEGTWSGKATNGDFCTPGKLKLCKIVPMADQQQAPNSNRKQPTYAAVRSRTNTEIRETFPNEFD